jgi:hypothetical protein
MDVRSLHGLVAVTPEASTAEVGSGASVLLLEHAERMMTIPRAVAIDENFCS